MPLDKGSIVRKNHLAKQNLLEAPTLSDEVYLPQATESRPANALLIKAGFSPNGWGHQKQGMAIASIIPIVLSSAESSCILFWCHRPLS